MDLEIESEEVLNRTVKSVLALTSRSIVLQLISAVALVLLGGLLSHSEIGIFIVVSALMRIFTFFTDLGLGAALIQKHGELEKDDLTTAFTIQTFLVAIVVIVGLFLTPIITSYVHLDSSGQFLYQVLVFTLFISSLKMIPSILLERRLAFEKQIIPQIVEALVFNFLVVLLAFKHFGVASYSWAILVSTLIGLPIYYLISPWRISLKFSKEVAQKLIRFGIPFQGKSVLAIVKDDLLIFFLSAVVGPGGIGYWGFAQRFAYYPFRLFVDTITKVTFPAYSRVQHEKSALKIGLEKSLMAVSLLVFPTLTLLSVLGRNLVLLIPKYQQWQPALPSLYFLCAGAAISALSNILVNALDATGHVKTTLGLMIFWIILTWLSTLIFVGSFGFTGIAVASFLVSTTIVITVYLVKQVVDFNFLANIYKPVIGCLLMGVIAYVMTRNLPNNFLTIILTGASGVIIYTTTMYLLARKELLADLAIVMATFKK